MTQVEMAKPLWDGTIFAKLWLKNMVEVLNFQILKIQVGEVEIFFLSSQETS